MQEHFIKNIEIKNFKCFENFKAEGFGRVNLIGGKNNVGKTAFMEAVYVNVYAQSIKSFITALDDLSFMRNFLNIQTYKGIMKENIEKLNNIFIQSNVNKIHFKINEKDGIKKYFFEYNETVIEPNSNEFSFSYERVNDIQFIDSLGMSYEQLMDNYSSIQKSDKESYLNNLLHIFDSNISAFKVIDEKPQCKINEQYLEIKELGDGIRHVISIVTSLYSSANGQLFIDELDNGIHYSMLDELWTIILTLSEKLNIQVFTTTHSKECIESFNRVQKELQHKDTYYFEMFKNKKEDKIDMRSLDQEQLEYELKHGEGFRGE